jgi:plastocyanin
LTACATVLQDLDALDTGASLHPRPVWGDPTGGDLIVRAIRAALSLFIVLAVWLPAEASAQGPPLPDPNFLVDVTESPCKYDVDDEIEKDNYREEGWGESSNFTRYPGDCIRMKFAYGPIVVKPGQNDVLVGPVTIEKPNRDGYITRFKPNLVTQDGTVPPVEEVHLHHGTWLALTNSYGNSAFFAAGEEKTIAPFPKGYGMPIKATDQWQLLYMVHSAVVQPMVTYITYEVDFVPKANGDRLGMKPALPIWLDVRPSAYPVFNTMRKYGGEDGECTWPKEECADFDPFEEKIPGNGLPANSPGTDYTLPQRGGTFGSWRNFQGATLIGIGGHLHPGGLRNEIDLVRDGKAQRIHNGIPSYWDREDPTKPGGPPTSWDFSMRVAGLPKYGVHLRPGDKLRSNAAYDTTIMSSYENMGIAVGLIVPFKEDGTPNAPGVDAFEAPIDDSERCDSGGLLADEPKLCINGFQETHGHYEENSNYSGPSGETELDAVDGPTINEVAVADFLYLPGDLTTRDTVGIPRVTLGSTLRFTNADGVIGIPHTITTCAYPCLGATGAAFPLPDGRTSTGREIELDSSQLGYGAPAISGFKNETIWSIPVTEQEGYKPGEVVTYYCRIHPSMRGAFKVAEGGAKKSTKITKIRGDKKR